MLPSYSNYTYEELIIENVLNYGEMPSVGSAANSLTKGRVIEYLENVDKIPFNKLNDDLQKIGLELYEPPVDGIYKFIHWRNDIRRAHKISGIKEPISSYTKVKDANSKYIIELHKGKGGSDYDHLHITNAKGEIYDKNSPFQP